MIAEERKVSLSQLVRDLLGDVVATRQSVGSRDAKELADRLAIHVAEVRRRLAG